MPTSPDSKKDEVMAQLENPLPERLRFNSQQDALDFASKCVQDSHRWLVRHDDGVAERYVKGVVDVAIRIRAIAEKSQYDLVVSAVPSPLVYTVIPRISRVIKTCTADSPCHWDESAVLVLIADPVEGIKKRIASTVAVRPEAFNERHKCLGDVFAPISNALFQFSGILTEWERCGLGIRMRGDRGSVDRVIEDGAQIDRSVADYVREVLRQGASHPHTAKVLAGALRIWLDRRTTWVGLVEGADLFFQVSDVMVCPREFSA